MEPYRPGEGLRSRIDALGRVRHLVSPNTFHYAHIAAWKRAYPEATAWASPGVRERAASQRIDVSFDADLGEEPAPAWRGEVDQLVFRGSRLLEEVIFFHRKTRTVILADLIENFEPGHEDLCDVDHFFPHALGRFLSTDRVNLDGVWNLVLSCWRCNCGEQGKSARVPAIRFLERLHRRNEYLIGSHHPLRETLMTQTGRTEPERRGFLQEMESFAMQNLVARWEPYDELRPVI